MILVALISGFDLAQLPGHDKRASFCTYYKETNITGENVRIMYFKE